MKTAGHSLSTRGSRLLDSACVWVCVCVCECGCGCECVFTQWKESQRYRSMQAAVTPVRITSGKQMDTVGRENDEKMKHTCCQPRSRATTWAAEMSRSPWMTLSAFTTTHVLILHERGRRKSVAAFSVKSKELTHQEGWCSWMLFRTRSELGQRTISKCYLQTLAHHWIVGSVPMFEHPSIHTSIHRL